MVEGAVDAKVDADEVPRFWKVSEDLTGVGYELPLAQAESQ